MFGTRKEKRNFFLFGWKQLLPLRNDEKGIQKSSPKRTAKERSTNYVKCYLGNNYKVFKTKTQRET